MNGHVDRELWLKRCWLTDKPSYVSEEECAEAAAFYEAKYASTDGKPLRAHKCRGCEYWHITSKPVDYQEHGTLRQIRPPLPIHQAIDGKNRQRLQALRDELMKEGLNDATDEEPRRAGEGSTGLRPLSPLEVRIRVERRRPRMRPGAED